MKVVCKFVYIRSVEINNIFCNIIYLAEDVLITEMWLSIFAAIESPPTMPPACRCMYGGTCYIDESGLPKCK